MTLSMKPTGALTGLGPQVGKGRTTRPHPRRTTLNPSPYATQYVAYSKMDMLFPPTRDQIIAEAMREDPVSFDQVPDWDLLRAHANGKV